MVLNRASNQLDFSYLKDNNLFESKLLSAIMQLIINTLSIYKEMLQIAVFYSE
jgi:hypothetical protein